MAWSDEPTMAQLGAVKRLIEGTIPNETIVKALHHLENTATRREVSDELGRLRCLYIDRKLDKENAFEGDIWEDFDYGSSTN